MDGGLYKSFKVPDMCEYTTYNYFCGETNSWHEASPMRRNLSL